MSPRESDDIKYVVTLKEHLAALIAASESRLDIKIEAAKEAAALLATAAKDALSLAREDQTKRFDAANELRGALDDTQTRLASKDSVSKLEASIAELRVDRAAMIGEFVGVRTFEVFQSQVQTQLQTLQLVRPEIEARRAGAAPMVQIAMLVVGALITFGIGALVTLIATRRM